MHKELSTLQMTIIALLKTVCDEQERVHEENYLRIAIKETGLELKVNLYIGDEYFQTEFFKGNPATAIMPLMNIHWPNFIEEHDQYKLQIETTEYHPFSLMDNPPLNILHIPEHDDYYMHIALTITRYK